MQMRDIRGLLEVGGVGGMSTVHHGDEKNEFSRAMKQKIQVKK